MFIKHLVRHGQREKGRAILLEALRILARRISREEPESVLESVVRRREFQLWMEEFAERPLSERDEGRPRPDLERMRKPAIHSIIKDAARRRERSFAAKLAAAIHEAFIGPEDPNGPIRAVDALSARIG
jgi:ribosomal protein S7